MPHLLDAYGRPITPDPDGWRECGISDTTGGTYYVGGRMSEPVYPRPLAISSVLFQQPGWERVESVTIVDAR